jgi:hypothetical protein
LLERVDAGIEDIAPHLADVVDQTSSLSFTGGRRGCDKDQRTNRPAIHRVVVVVVVVEDVNSKQIASFDPNTQTLFTI